MRVVTHVPSRRGTGAEIVWVENNLPTFRGRVERDDWPGQAAALIAAQPSEWSLRSPPVPNGSANGPLN